MIPARTCNQSKRLNDRYEKGRNQGIKHSGAARQIEASEKAYRELKVAHAISPVDNPSKITKDRKEIARLKTVLRQKEIAAAAEAPVVNN